MLRSMFPHLQSQPIALAHDSQGMAKGLWIGTQWIGTQTGGFRSSLCCGADHLQIKRQSGFTATTEQGSDWGNTPYPASLLAIGLNHRSERQSGVYRAQPPVPD